MATPAPIMTRYGRRLGIARFSRRGLSGTSPPSSSTMFRLTLPSASSGSFSLWATYLASPPRVAGGRSARSPPSGPRAHAR